MQPEDADPTVITFQHKHVPIPLISLTSWRKLHRNGTDRHVTVSGFLLESYGTEPTY